MGFFEDIRCSCGNINLLERGPPPEDASSLLWDVWERALNRRAFAPFVSVASSNCSHIPQKAIIFQHSLTTPIQAKTKGNCSACSQYTASTQQPSVHAPLSPYQVSILPHSNAIVRQKQMAWWRVDKGRVKVTLCERCRYQPNCFVSIVRRDRFCDTWMQSKAYKIQFFSLYKSSGQQISLWNEWQFELFSSSPRNDPAQR